MILGDVEETITTVEIDEETYEELYKVCKCLWFLYRSLVLVRAVPEFFQGGGAVQHLFYFTHIGVSDCNAEHCLVWY